jgi:hypothetical protein
MRQYVTEEYLPGAQAASDVDLLGQRLLAAPRTDPLNQVPSIHPLRRRSLSPVYGLHRYYAPVRRLAPVHHRLRLVAFPMPAVRISACRSVARPPRFRRVPFLRDVVFDHGRASAPRIAVPHMLPSTLLTVSASATLELSRLNSTPNRIVVYASQPPSPPTKQHSLPGARYGLPAPVFHRLDRASFAWRTSNLHRVMHCDGCRVASLLAMTSKFALSAVPATGCPDLLDP